MFYGVSRLIEDTADTSAAAAEDFSNQSHLANARGLNGQIPLCACNYRFFPKMDLIAASSH